MYYCLSVFFCQFTPLVVMQIRGLRCIVSMAWYSLMLIHIWQHWQLTKALAKWKVMKRNIIT